VAVLSAAALVLLARVSRTPPPSSLPTPTPDS